MDICHTRLSNQHLQGKLFKTPVEVVGWLGAVQAQDFSAAKWSVGQRLENSTNDLVEAAYNQGSILRTHVMRPTWHFVLPEDVRWMLKLTAPQVKKLMGHYNRKLELDEVVFKKSSDAICKALENQTYLTRQELKKILEQIGIKTDVQRLAHLMMWAELDGLICSGPKKGKQLTYALLEERVPQFKELSHQEALAKLALMYFTSHGPAQIIDFAWWSGLPITKAKEAVELIKNKLEQEIVNEKDYWFSPTQLKPLKISHHVRLLSIFDEYTIAYKDRSDMSSDRRDIERLLKMGNALTAVVVIDGKVAGTWKKQAKGKKTELVVQLFRKPSLAEKQAVMEQATKYGQFFDTVISTQIAE